eukprot:scaffold3058_cov232-Pinguiococcus_pyrenoidosus.AAC.10
MQWLGRAQQRCLPAHLDQVFFPNVPPGIGQAPANHLLVCFRRPEHDDVSPAEASDKLGHLVPRAEHLISIAWPLFPPASPFHDAYLLHR